MNALPVCILSTRDDHLRQRIMGLLGDVAVIHELVGINDIRDACRTLAPVLILLDARQPDFRERLATLCGAAGTAPVLAFAVPGSDPAMLAGQFEVFAVESPEVERQVLQTHVRRAVVHSRLLAENRLLKRKLTEAPPRAVIHSQREIASCLTRSAGGDANTFSRALREIGRDLKAVLTHLIEEVAGITRASRVGIFLSDPGSPRRYRLRAGLRCLAGTDQFAYSDNSPLVQWMRHHAHFVARSTLDQAVSEGDNLHLEQALDALGADVLIPLHQSEGLIGWMFLGRRISGIAYSSADVESFMSLAEHVGTMLETAMLQDALTLQKTLLENVLQQVPVGIVAADTDGIVCAMNEVATSILAVSRQEAMYAPACRVNGQLADLMARCLDGSCLNATETWKDAHAGKLLSAALRRLKHGDRCCGVVAIIEDYGAVERLREESLRSERVLFWTELAAAIAHEVRNPLVAIQTFVQLLPERYQDEKFRTEFRQLAGVEIERVNRLVDQIQCFANQPKLEMTFLKPGKVLESALQQVVATHPDKQVALRHKVPPGLPTVHGDSQALMAGFAHVLTNAFEAVAEQAAPAVEISCERIQDGNGRQHLRFVISDNGRGMPSEGYEKAFSPFFTTKPRGIGLGLPIAKRIFHDHGGAVAIEPVATGCKLSITLPASKSASDGA